MVRVAAAPESFPQLKPSLGTEREKILLCGDSFSGKSFAWIQLAQKLYEEDKNRPDPQKRRVFVLDTNESATKFLGDGREFAHLYHANGGNVYVFQCTDYEKSAGGIHYIFRMKVSLRASDWIVVDVANDWDDQSQDHIAQIEGARLDDLRAQKAFGGFEPQQWNSVKRQHDALINALLKRCKSNLLMLSHIKPIVDHYNRNQVIKALFDDIGMKPQTRDYVYKQLDTVMFVWSRSIKVNNKNFVRRYMHIRKDRGETFNITEEFGKTPETSNVLTELKRIRAEGHPPENASADIIKVYEAAQERAASEAAAMILAANDIEIGLGDSNADSSN